MRMSLKHWTVYHDNEASLYVQCMPKVGVGHQLDIGIFTCVLVLS